MSVRWVIGLGASLGDRANTLQLAASALACTPGAQLLGCSRLWRSPPAGGVARGSFLNAALALRWAGEPLELLARARAIERRLGRRAGLRWADRPLDLDLLWGEGLRIGRPDLQVPHPRLQERPFALIPLLEVAPDAEDPASGLPYRALVAVAGTGLAPAGVLGARLRVRGRRCIGEPFHPT